MSEDEGDKDDEVKDQDEDACEETKDGEEAEDEEVEEALKPLIMRDPGQPTAREREEHEVTHPPSSQTLVQTLLQGQDAA